MNIQNCGQQLVVAWSFEILWGLCDFSREIVPTLDDVWTFEPALPPKR